MDRSPRVAKILSWYAAQIAAQLGAHVIKVKLPTDHIEQDAARKVYEKTGIPLRTAAERMRHVGNYFETKSSCKFTLIIDKTGKTVNKIHYIWSFQKHLYVNYTHIHCIVLC